MKILQQALFVGCLWFGSVEVCRAQVACTTTFEMTTLPAAALRPDRLRFSSVLGQPFTHLQSAELSLAGSEVLVRVALVQVDLPVFPQPFELKFPAGLADGEYRVRTQVSREGASCPAQVFPLRIGTAVTAIPATQPWGLLGLCLGLILLSAGSLRRLR